MMIEVQRLTVAWMGMATRFLAIGLWIWTVPGVLAQEGEGEGFLSFSKVFSPNTIGPGSRSTLTFTINNPTGLPAENVAFTDTLPANVTIATPANASTTCLGGVLSAPDGGSTVSYSGGSVPAHTACTVTVDVTSSTVGTHTNVSGDLTSDFGNSGSATDDLDVVTTLPGFSKSFSPSSVSLGGRSTLTFTIDNSANASRIGDLEFTDILPSGMVIADPPNASTDCISASAPNTTLIAVAGTDTIELEADGSTFFPGFEVLPAGGSCGVTVDVVATGTGSLENVSGELLADFTSAGFASATLDVTVTPLALEKKFLDDPVPQGGSVELEFTINNFSRTETVTDIAFTDDLNATLPGLTLGSLLFNDCGGSVSGFGTGTLSYSGGSVGPGGSCTVRVSLDVPQAAVTGAYPNTTGAITGTVDGTGVTGNMASDVLFVAAAPVLTKEFLEIETFASDPVVNPGDDVVLRFTITNTSATSMATDITFIDELTNAVPGTGFLPFPVSVTLPPTPNPPCGVGSSLGFVFPDIDRQGLQLTGGNLAAGDSCAFEVTLSVPADMSGGTYTNTTGEIMATVDAQTVTGDKASDDLVVVGAPSLKKEFLGPAVPGETATLQFTLTHAPDAPADATGIAFTDDLAAMIPGATATLPPTPDPPCGAGSSLTGSVGDTFLTFAGGSLMPGESCVFTVDIDIPAATSAGTYTNTTSALSATVSGVAAVSTAATADLLVSSLTFTKEFLGDPAVAGEEITLRFTIANNNPTNDATITFFTDSLALNLAGLAATGPPSSDSCGGTLSGTTGLIYLGGSVLAGESCTIDVPVMVPAAAANGSYANITSALSTSLGTVPAALDTLTVDSTRIQLTKTFTDDPVVAGGTATLEFTLTNLDATRTLTDIEFTDDLDAALSGLVATGLPQSNICGSGSSISGTSTLTFSGGTLAAGGSCTFSVNLDIPGTVPTDPVTNTTSGLTGMLDGLAVSGEPASDDLSFAPVSFSKEFLSSAIPGGTATLRFTIANDDPSNAATVSFTDDLDAMLAGAAAVGLPETGVCGTGTLSGTSTISLSGGTVDPASSCVFDVTVQIPTDALAGSYSNTTSTPVVRLLEQPVAVDPASAGLTVDPALTVSIADESISEGDGPAATTATVSRNSGTTGNLTVTLMSDDTSEATVIGSVTISSGQSTSLPFDIDAVDDAIVDGTQTVTITATASGHADGTDTVEVTDDDVPELTVTIAAASIGEGDGAAATTATVSRNTDTSSDLTVTLVSDDTTEATVIGSVTISSGQDTSSPFDIDAVDDTIVDGTQTVTITATASGHADGTDTVEVTDDDVPELTVTIAAVSIGEGDGAAATTATVSRNTDTSSDLTVTLVSDDTTEATVIGSVTISSGQDTSSPFDIDAVDDAIVDGTQTVTITASESGHADGTDTVDVTDDDDPELSLTIVDDFILEGDGAGATTATVSRNTDTTSDLVVILSSGDTSEATVSASVTIPAGQSTSSAFNIDAVNDGIADGTQTVTITASESGHADGTDTVDVHSAPGFSKTFAPNPLVVDGTTTLTFTIDNTGSAVAADSLAFSDSLPSGLEVAATPNVVNGCGGTVTAAAGTTTISLSGGSVAAGSSCAISVDVQGNTEGLKTNTSGDLTSTLGNSGSASDTLEVRPLPTLTIGVPSESLTSSGPVTFPVTYDEADTINLTSGDITLNTVGTATGSVSVTDGTTANPTVTIDSITGDGSIGISIASGTSSSTVGDDDGAGPSDVFDVDNTAPTVTVDQAVGQADPTNSAPILFTAVFSEGVSGFETGDVSLSGTAGATTDAVTEVAPNDGTTYEISVSGMTGAGTVIAAIDAGVATDSAGNDNEASTSSDNVVTLGTLIVVLDASSNLVISDLVDEADDISIRVVGEFLEIIKNPNGLIGSGISGASGSGSPSDPLLIPLTAFTGGIIVNAGGGDDTLGIDLTEAIDRPITFNGGDNDTASPGDVLELTGGDSTDATYTFVNANDGSVDVSGNATITYTGLEPITATINALNITLNYSTSAETITVSDAGGGQTSVNSTAGELVIFNNPSATLRINAGDTGADIINVGTLPSLPYDLFIDGEGGSDTINVNGAVSLDNNDLELIAETISTSASIATGTGSISLTVDSLGLGAAVSGSSSLVIDPLTSGRSIGLGGGSGDLNLDDTELAFLQDGFSGITIGDFVAGDVTIDTVTLVDPLTLITAGEVNDGSGTDIDAGGNAVVLDGTVAPGVSPGILVVTANFSLAIGSTLDVEIGGATAGTGAGFHDQVDVTGTVTIGNGVALLLSSFGGFTPSANQSYVLINNDDVDAVTGTFSGFSEGATVTSDLLGSGLPAIITYVGGDGNDVVLSTDADGDGDPDITDPDDDNDGWPDDIETDNGTDPLDAASTPGAGIFTINDVSMDEGDSGTTAFDFTVEYSGVATTPFTIDFATSDGTAWSDLVDPVAHLLSFGSFGAIDGRFDAPGGVAVNAAGEIIVADTGNHRIQVFDSAGNHQLSFGVMGSADGQFDAPGGVAVNGAGEIIVADTSNHRIQVFDSGGNHQLSIGTGGTADGQFDLPCGLAVDAAGDLYVADTGNNRIQVFDSAGNHQLSFGAGGTADGQFDALCGVAVDAAGNIYVSDTGNDRVQIFDFMGNHLLSFGANGSADGEFDQPLGCAVTAAGDFYVVDSGNHRVQVFDNAGNHQLSYGSGGNANGQFDSPAGVTVDAEGRIYVADTSNHRVQVVAIADYISTTGTLSFDGTVGDTETVSVAVRGDELVEPDETFTLTVCNTTATGTILDADADDMAPVITLNGVMPVILECGLDIYTELGATASDDRDLSVSVIIGGDTVDATTPGTYVVTYDATDDAGNAAVQVMRTVEVVDTTAPVITLNGAATVTVECGIDTYTELGATAADDCDPSVSVIVGGDTVDEATPGTYVVTYDATDASGNAAVQVTRTVEVVDTTAPVITLNGAAAVTVECGIGTYTELGATAADACDPSVSVVIGGDMVDVATPGTYVVTYDATDASGNAAVQVTRTVEVVDTTAPVITLNGAATVTVECGIDTYTELGATAADACDPSVSVVVGGDMVDVATPGIYVVTYDATDASGNAAVQVTRTVEVVDTTAPVITLNGAATVTVECGIDSYTELGATAADACDPSVSVVVGGDTVDEATPGTYVVTYDATDASGNAAIQVTRTVEVVDTTAPVITLNGAATVTVECGIDSYTELGATAADACDPSVSVVVGGDTVDEATPGTYVVTYDATDASGNAAVQVTRTVEVVDTTAPVITLNGDVTVTLECGIDSYTELGATAADACDSSVSVVIGGDAVDAATPGTYVVTYDATDASGNAAVQVTRTVEVVDTTAPVITLSGDATITLECDIDTYTELGATAEDICDPSVSVVIGGDAVDATTPGTYVVTYDATDASGNAAIQVTRTVEVGDSTPSVITLNGDAIVFLECGVDTYDELGAVVADACDPSVQVVVGGDVVDTTPTPPEEVNGVLPPNSSASVRVFVVTYNATDAAGNTADEVTRTVIVRDTTAPVITLNGEDEVTLECGVDTYTELGAVVQDICDANVELKIGGDPVDLTKLGTYVVTYNATDANGNVADEVTRTVTVVDTTAPVIRLTGEAAVMIECGIDRYTELGAIAEDACDSDIEVAVGGDTVDSVKPGIYTVTYNATDSAGNVAAEVRRTVIVADTEPPVITLNGEVMVTLECGVDTYEELGATADDACDPEVTVTVGGDTVDPATPGIYTVTYNATDSAGNAADEVTRTVVVGDTEPPVITLNGAAMVTLECGVDTYEELGATAEDACDPEVTVTVGGDTVDPATPGIYTVTYNATDSAGNAADEVTRTVVVGDTEPPVITLNGEATVTIECSVDTYEELGATAEDVCDSEVAVIVGGDTVDPAAPGTYTVTYNATDSAGNAADEVTRTVVVEDTRPPVITLNGEGSITLECGVDTYAELGATAEDACDPEVVVNVGGDTVDTNRPGIYTVTYNATDASGNVADEVTRTVEVVSTSLPELGVRFDWVGKKPIVFWDSKAGVTYQLQVSENLRPDSWRELAVLVGDGTTLEVEDSISAAGTGFYRLLILPTSP